MDSPNCIACSMCGTYDLRSFERLCPDCKRVQAVIDANKPKESNTAKINHVKNVTESVLARLNASSAVFNEEDFRCGVVSAIAALFPEETKEALGR